MAVSAELVAELNRIGAEAESKVAVGADEFNSMIRTYTQKLLPKQALTFLKWLAMGVLRRVVLKTPVDTGRARGNWQVTVSSPAEGEVDVTDKRGRDTIANGKAGMADARYSGIIWLTNNLAYILSLEGGWSQQAPVGMLAVSLEEMIGKSVK